MIWDWIDIISQGAVFITGVSSIALVSSGEAKTRMIAGIMGLLGEPFWLYTTIYNGQYGIAFLVLIYSFNWFMVFYKNRKLVLEINK
tara:strand:- start:1519 stop:1779 length:261 start_codon:yes stop_codon:yes gene_type:complete